MSEPVVPYHAMVPLRWSDMDAYGHVNNVQFLRLLEDARITALREWFGADNSPLAEGVVVSRHEIEYYAPLVYRPESVEVGMWVTDVGPAGFDLAYAVREPAAVGATVYAVAQSGIVLYDFESARPRRMSQAHTQVVEAHRGDPVEFRWGRG